MDARETSIFTAVLIACIIVLVVVVFFTATIIRYQRRNLKLYRAKIMAEISTLENERKRVSADLHDELGPIVAAIKMKMSSLSVNAEDQRTMDRIDEHIVELIGRMKGISNDLMPVILLKKGLVATIDMIVADHNQSGGPLSIKWEHDKLPDLPEIAVINLYRIVREIIHNAIRHSGATELKIEIRFKNNILSLVTHDNGKGYDFLSASREHAGLGLRNLLSRAEMLGGKMFTETGKGEGTYYYFEIPIDQ